MTNTTDTQPMLPGLELEAPGQTHGQSAMRVAVAETIQALHDANLLEPRHVGLAQLALTLADAVEKGAQSGRASAAAMAAGQLRETLLALPQPQEAEAGAAFLDWVEDMKSRDPDRAP